MKMRSVVGCVVLSVVATGLAVADELPNPSEFSIRSVSAQGSGCQSGTVSTLLSPDSKELSVLFDHFTASSGGTGPEVEKKTCDINLELVIPSGWSFGLLSADYRGFASLEANTQGLHEVVYSFNGATLSRSFSSNILRGPYAQDYLFHNVLPLQTVNWSSCGVTSTTLTLRTAVLARSLVGHGGGTGRLPKADMTLDSVDASLKQSFGIGWRRCGGSHPGNPVPPAPPSPPPAYPPAPPAPPMPPSYPPSGDIIDIHRFFNGRDRLFTSNYAEGAGRYSYEGVAFRIFRSSNDPSMRPLYRCVSPRYENHFVSLDSSCEGARREGLLGFVTGRASPGAVVLYQFSNPRNPHDRLITTSYDEGVRAHFRYEGVVGYAFPGSSGHDSPYRPSPRPPRYGGRWR